MPARSPHRPVRSHRLHRSAHRRGAGARRRVAGARRPEPRPAAGARRRAGAQPGRPPEVATADVTRSVVGGGAARARATCWSAPSGPFLELGEPAVQAALRAGASYLDSTGEPPFVRTVFQKYGPQAADAGAGLLPAFGYDYVPGNLAAGIALERAGMRRGPGRRRLLHHRADEHARRRAAVPPRRRPGSCSRPASPGATAACSRSGPRSGCGRSPSTGSGAAASRSPAPSTWRSPASLRSSTRSTSTWGGPGPLSRPVQAGSLLLEGLRRVPAAADGLTQPARAGSGRPTGTGPGRAGPRRDRQHRRRAGLRRGR